MSAEPGARRLPLLWLVVALVALAAVLVPLRGAIGRLLGVGPPPAGGPAATPQEEPSPPPCRYEDRLTEHRHPDDWQRTLVDTSFRLHEDYAPPDMASTTDAGFEAGFPIRALVIDDLRALREAAREAGVPIEPTFGYRSYRYQRDVFADWRARRGRKRALRIAARPGHSEHQLGTALDFKSAGADNVDRSWGEEPAGRWMAENAWRFGFVLTYPRGERAVSCYAYEPWHFRYFGPRLAGEINESGLTAREFLWRRFHGPRGPSGSV